MTVYVADTHAQVQGVHSVVKMATVLEVYITEEVRSVVGFFFSLSLRAKLLNAKDTHNLNVFYLLWEVFVAKSGLQLG
jgi:hypothetical protein